MRKATDRGKVASYIPELATVDPHQFGVSVCLRDGMQASAGDATTAFSIQSISKVFSLAMALEEFNGGIWQRLGREPSNHAFNSIVELELEQGRPRNPFVNAGALVVTDALLAKYSQEELLARVLQFLRSASDDEAVFANGRLACSEMMTGHRNIALAHFLKSCGNLNGDCENVLRTYFHQCAIEMNCEQLAKAGRFLAGLDTRHQRIDALHVRSINAMMMMAGHYDGSGDFAYSVGLPAKSGVGGGILAIVPGKASIAVWSPGLNRFGNSLLGTMALEALARFAGWSLFEPEAATMTTC